MAHTGTVLGGLAVLGLLVKISLFRRSLHWPVDAGDLGVGGVSYLEVLILYEQWAGERLVLEKSSASAWTCWSPNFSVGGFDWTRH